MIAPHGHAGGRAGAFRDRIETLQILRGLAASGVVVEHLLERYARRGALPGDLPDFAGRLGQIGVATFFAISGFVMVYIAIRPDRDPPSGRAFLWSRFARIAPLYYLTTLLAVACGWIVNRVGATPAYRLPTVTEMLLSFAFVPHRGVHGVIQPVYALGWTLHYEMAFYGLFALGLALWGRRGAGLVLVTLGLLLVAGTQVGAPPEAVGPRIVAYVFTRPIIGYFAIGMVIALVRQSAWGRLPVVSMRVTMPIVLSALAVATLDLSVVSTMIAIALALGLAVLPAPPAQASPGSVPGVSRVFGRAFGDASYSIYLTHSFVLGAFAAATAPMAARGAYGLLAMVGLGCIVCAVTGWLSWRLVELPIAARIRRRTGGMAGTARSAR